MVTIEARLTTLPSPALADLPDALGAPMPAQPVMRRAGGRDLATVASLVGLSCIVQIWLVCRSTLPALDAVSYVAMAQAIERDGLLFTLRNEPEQPLFPWLVWAAHALGTRAGLINITAWGTSAQMAATVPLVLAVVPVFYFTRLAAGRTVAVAGGVFYCTLYAVARLGADGISDSTHLLLLATGLWAAAAYWQRASTGDRVWSVWLVASGISLALALLARSEAILVPPALVLTLAWLARRGGVAWWPDVALGSSALTLGIAAVLGPYLLACQATTPGEMAERLLGGRAVSERMPFNAPPGTPAVREVAWEWHDGRPLAFGRKDASLSTRFRGFWPSIGKFVKEVFQTLQYGVAALAVLGLYLRPRREMSPLERFCLVLAVAYAAGGLYVAMTHGYLEGRHLMPLVVLSLPWAGAGALAIARGFSARVGREALVRWLLVGGVGVACISITFTPLNASRTTHRQASDWIAASSEAGAVLDSHGYSALSSGRKTYRYEAAPAAIEDPHLRFVIVEQVEFEADTPRGATMREVLGRWAEPAVTLADPQRRPDRTVLVFRWQPQHFAQAQDVHHAR